MADDTNPQSPPTNQPNQAPADTTAPSGVTTGDRIEPAAASPDVRSDEQRRAEETTTIGPDPAVKTSTIPGSYAGPADPALAGPGDEVAREGQVNEPDDRTLEQHRLAQDAERGARGESPTSESVQDRTDRD